MEEDVKDFGRRIFNHIGTESPSTLSKTALSGKLMRWSMTKEDLKFNLFRLVDVLPTLKSSKAIAKHTREYLQDSLREINPLLSMPLELSDNILSSGITAAAVKFAVNQMASQFICGSSPERALSALTKIRKRGMCFTVDLLGEFSLSEKEAKVYLERYLEVLDVLSSSSRNWPASTNTAKFDFSKHPGEISPVCVSVKLSALYSQCSTLNFDKSVEVLKDRLSLILRKAKESQAIIYVDAEDSANNSIIYKVFKDLFSSQEFIDFPYPGIVVQAYAKNAESTLQDLISFARKRGSPIAVRLVKGAYWDYETIISKQNHWESPLFKKKESSDANYEKLSRLLIDNHKHCLPAFGSHNIRSLSQACIYAKQSGLTSNDIELQMLFGMADPIANAFQKEGYLVRFYSPVGEILPGMGYLVRRLLENTSNESFLKHTFFDASGVEHLLEKPQFVD